MTERLYVKLRRDGHVAILTLSRPERLNALDLDVLNELRSAVHELNDDPTVRVALVTGEGRAFVAGADIAQMRSMGREEARRLSSLGHETFDLIEAARFPVIAVVNGFALGGGCELALACDYVLAAETAKFGQPEVRLGVIPGFGGTARLGRRVGVAKARQLIYTGATVDAHEALRIGLVDGVLPGAELMEAARREAGVIAEMGPVAVAHAKRVLREGEGMTLVAACRHEADAFADCFTTQDQREGMDAFLAKRPPHFEGR